MDKLIEKIEQILGRTITHIEYQIIWELYENYEEENILFEVEFNKFQKYPLHYTRKVMLTKYTKKSDDSGSEWIRKFKEQFK